jgi:hypothetical protein
MYEQQNNSRWGRVAEWIVVISTIALTLPAYFVADALLMRLLMIGMALGAVAWGFYLIVTGPES